MYDEKKGREKDCFEMDGMKVLQERDVPSPSA